MRRSLVGSAILAALIAVAGCSHYLMADREPWRHEAELECLNSGVAEETPGRVRIATISGPGACGIDYPLKVSELGESGPLGYDDEPAIPPGSIPNASMPQQWPGSQPGVQSYALPPPQGAGPQYGQPQYGPPPQPYGQSPYAAPPQYGAAPYGAPPQAAPNSYGTRQVGAPMSLAAPGIEPPVPDGVETSPDPYSSAPNYNVPNATSVDIPASLYSPRPMMAAPGADQPRPAANEPLPPLGPPSPLPRTAGPVEVKPAATLACPLVSELDKWISQAVQPAALKWFHQPVAEIKQISAYSCRGMNGDPNAHISEHAFGNAIDIAEFDLADGQKVSVQYGWRGTPEEQGFLHDVQGAACQDFTTVLAPGANVYHYNHIHVDLMRRASRRYICEPTAIPGEVAAARARSQYAARYGRPDVTGSIKSKQTSSPSLGYSSEDDDKLPLAVPGDD